MLSRCKDYRGSLCREYGEIKELTIFPLKQRKRESIRFHWLTSIEEKWQYYNANLYPTP